MLDNKQFQELREKVRAGKDALGELLQGCRDAVRDTSGKRINKLQLRDMIDSTDAFQEVAGNFFDSPAMMALFKAETLDDFIKHLQASARNIVFNQGRRKKRRQTVPFLEDEEVSGREKTPSTEPREQEAAAKLLAQMPSEKDRKIWQMKAVEGRAYDEIAEAVGLTPANVKKRFDRARQRLKKRLS